MMRSWLPFLCTRIECFRCQEKSMLAMERCSHAAISDDDLCVVPNQKCAPYCPEIFATVISTRSGRAVMGLAGRRWRGPLPVIIFGVGFLRRSGPKSCRRHRNRCLAILMSRHSAGVVSAAQSMSDPVRLAKSCTASFSAPHKHIISANGAGCILSRFSS